MVVVVVVGVGVAVGVGMAEKMLKYNRRLTPKMKKTRIRARKCRCTLRSVHNVLYYTAMTGTIANRWQHEFLTQTP